MYEKQKESALAKSGARSADIAARPINYLQRQERWRYILISYKGKRALAVLIRNTYKGKSVGLHAWTHKHIGTHMAPSEVRARDVYVVAASTLMVVGRRHEGVDTRKAHT